MTEESSCLPRAPSNLELLSQTAAWKNAVEQTRVVISPSENILSPRSNGSGLIEVRSPLLVHASATKLTHPGSISPAASASLKAITSNDWGNEWGTMGDASNSAEVAETGVVVPVSKTETHPSSTSGAVHTTTIQGNSPTNPVSNSTASFLPPAVSTSSIGPLTLPTDFSSVQSLFHGNNSGGGSNEESFSASSLPRRPFLGPRSAGTAFVEAGRNFSNHSLTVRTSSPSSLLQSSASSHSWTAEESSSNVATSATARTASSSDVSLLDELARDNAILRHELSQKNQQIQALEECVEQLQHKVSELRQLPVGKISQIPVDELLQLMQVFGSEVTDHAQLPSSLTKTNRRPVQKASIVRQFRRWNPNFHEFFEHKGGKWIPKLGVQGELQRRAKSRAQRRANKAQKLPTKKAP